MATNFPTSLDTLTNPVSTDTLSGVPHATQHQNENDAIEALQAKVGIDSSSVTTSLDYKTSNATGSTKLAATLQQAFDNSAAITIADANNDQLTITNNDTTAWIDGLSIVSNVDNVNLDLQQLGNASAVTVTTSGSWFTTADLISISNNGSSNTPSWTLVDLVNKWTWATLDLTTSNATAISLNITSSSTTQDTINVQADSLAAWGTCARFASNSSQNSARNLVEIVNDNSSATGAIPLLIQQDAVVSSNFKKLIQAAWFTIYSSDGTTPNWNLSGLAWDICLNWPSGQAFFCGWTTTWTAM